MSILSERLTQVAMEKQLSTRDIANATGTSKSAIQRYLSGERENVPVSFVQAFARAYNVDASYLMGWTNDRRGVQAEAEDEVWELREQLRRRPEMRMLFMASKNAKKEDLLRAVRIIEALKRESGYRDE